MLCMAHVGVVTFVQLEVKHLLQWEINALKRFAHTLSAKTAHQYSVSCSIAPKFLVSHMSTARLPTLLL